MPVLDFPKGGQSPLAIGDYRDVRKGLPVTMSEVTRPELDAKLEAVEARLETKVVRIEGKIDLMLQSVALQTKETHSLRGWAMSLIASIVISAIGVVIGVYGANASIVQAVIAAFQAAQQAPATTNATSQGNGTKH